MLIDLGTVLPGSTIRFPLSTYDSNDPTASVTVTGLAAADVEVYKDGSTTQRASDAGYTVTVDFDSVTGQHVIEIDLADNTTANFYEAGSEYLVGLGDHTVDAGTLRTWIGRFRIGYPGAILDTTIATLSSQTSFTLEDGSADNDAYNGSVCVVHDLASAVQIAQGIVTDYVGSTKTVTLGFDPGIFTMAAGDNISIFPRVNAHAWNGVALSTTNPLPNAAADAAGGLPISDAGGLDLDARLDAAVSSRLAPTVASRTLDVTATGAAGIDWGNVENPTTAVDLSGTDIQLCDTVTTNTDMRGTDSAALASVVGALTDAAAAGDPTTADTIMQYVKQLVNVLVGTTGVTTFPAEAAPANNVSLAEVIRAIHADVTGLNGDAMRGTDNAALASVLGALADAAAAGDPTASDTVVQYVKQLVNVLVGTTGVTTFPAEAAPANNVSLAEVLRAIHVDVTGLNGDAMRGTDSAALASVCTEARLAELDAANLPTTADNIETDTQNIQSRLPAALVSGRMDSNVSAINDNNNAAVRQALAAGQIVPGTVDNTAFTPTTTEFEADDITEATADHYNGRIVVWTSGVLAGQATDITNYSLVAGRGHFTVTAQTEAAGNNDTFVIV